MTTATIPNVGAPLGVADITIGLTGPDWEPTASMRYYAQRGDAARSFAFGATEAEALANLLQAEHEIALTFTRND